MFRRFLILTAAIVTFASISQSRQIASASRALDQDLLRAARQGRKDLVVMLLERGASQEANDGHRRTPLILAAKYGHSGVVEALLGKGADPNAKDSDHQTALVHASAKGYTSIARALLLYGADPEERPLFGESPLTYAVRNCASPNPICRVVG